MRESSTMATMANSRPLENEPTMEGSFRRLISALESERERMRSTYQTFERERQSTTDELQRIRRETEEWCSAERQKVNAEWRYLDNLAESLRGFWPNGGQMVGSTLMRINCSGVKYTLQRSLLQSIEDSYLAQMFSEEFESEIPKDADGNFYLDFNSTCFGVIVEYLQNRRLKPDCPVPIVPASQQQNMDMLAQALNLRPFLRENRINPYHSTSLQVAGNTIVAAHPGWQVITSEYPLPVAHPSYFEVQIVLNPDVKGGLAIGICSKIPTGTEVHSIRLPNAVLYNSSNGLLGDCFEELGMEEAAVQLSEGSSFGVRYDPSTHHLSWFRNRIQIGIIKIKEEKVPFMTTMYAALALYVPQQQVQVDFHAKAPHVDIAEPG